MPNTYLDARSNYPGQTGPSRDWHAIAAREPVYRQEPWQIQANRLPVNLMGPAQRPVTFTKQDPAIPLQRLPVSVRSSNQRPVEAGMGPQSSTWRVSDPGWQSAQDASVAGLPSGALPGMGLIGQADTGAGCGALSLPTSLPVLALLGAVIGYGIWKCRK